jgi:tetratricopeptide (TPR) repeat protein
LPVLFVLTARSEDLATRPRVRQSLDAVLAMPSADHLAVDALPPDDAARFVGEMLGFRADLQGRVIERIGGNPLFAVQLVSDWVARGLLTPDGEGYHLADSGPVPIPTDLHAAWDARLDTFLAGRSPQSEVALEAAAALGGPVNTEEWMAVCARLHARPGNLLRDLLDQGIATASEDGWDLVHGMLRETLHERAKAANRWASLQAACAETLQSEAHDRTRLGRHLLAAGETRRAIPVLMEGLEADMRSGNLARAEETAHQVQHALASDDTPVSTLAAAALQRAQLARLRGRIHAAQRELAWCEGAIDAGTHPRQAAVACAEAAVVAYRAGDLARVMERAATGEQLANRVGAVQLMARCLEVRARALTDRAEWDTARRTYQQARHAFEASGDALGMATCDLGSGWVACSEGALDLADEHIRTGLETFEQMGNQEQMGTAQNMLGEVARARGATDAAADHYRLALALHDNCGASASATIAALNLAIVLVAARRAGEAREKVTRRLRTMVGLGHEQFADAAKLVLLVCDAQEGQWQGWLAKFEAVAHALDASGQTHQDLATLAVLAGTHAADAGLQTEAAAATQLAVDQRRRLGGR